MRLLTRLLRGRRRAGGPARLVVLPPLRRLRRAKLF